MSPDVLAELAEAAFGAAAVLLIALAPILVLWPVASTVFWAYRRVTGRRLEDDLWKWERRWLIK